MNPISGPGDSHLQEFIRAAKANGASDEFILKLLGQKGWSEEKILSAFEVHYELATGIAVPVRGRRAEAARDAFLYLLSFITLGTWTVALGWAFFTLIDLRFPDPLSFRYPEPDASSGAQLANYAAAMLVALPLFLFVTSIIARQTRDNPERLNRRSGNG